MAYVSEMGFGAFVNGLTIQGQIVLEPLLYGVEQLLRSRLL